MSGLPEGWELTKLGKLGGWTSGGTPSRSEPEYYGAGTPWVKTGDLDDGPILSVPESITDAGLKNSAAKRLPKGTLLVAMYGATIGRLGVLQIEAATNQACAALLPNGRTADYIPWVFHFLMAERENLRRIGQGGAQPNISQAILKDYDIPLPPLNEQRRIVAKLEALQARSRRARQALDAVPPLLEKLRQSILAAAFRGDLTKEWRAENKEVEPASELLQRIRVERRKKWEEAELAKMRAKGKAPKDDEWKAKYKEPEPLDSTELPVLPPSWSWATLESLTDAERGIPYGIVLTGEPFPGGVATVRCGDIKAFSIDVAALKRVDPSVANDYARTELQGDEVLIAIRGTVGATAVASAEMVGMNISREVAMIPLLSGLAPRCLMFCLAGPEAQGRLLKRVKGVAQAGINLADLRTLPVPLAPQHEQQPLLLALEQALARINQVQTAYSEALEACDGLERATLAKAFRGELCSSRGTDAGAPELAR